MKALIKQCATVLFFFLVSIQLFAQARLSDRYERGLELFRQQKYDAAIEVFRPLSRQEQSNPYVEYASFYFGLSALKDGQADLAKNMFLQVQSKYPRWNKMPEVNYWLVATYFELGDYALALDLIESLEQDNKISRKTEEYLVIIKNHYLYLAGTNRLQQLLSEYPQDKEVATQLVRNIAGTLYNAEQRVLIDSLVAAFDIEMDKLGVITQEASIKKSVYNVAVMLPFLYEKLNPSSSQQGNQFIIDLYKGIKMAASDLQSEGINVNAYAYDTERDFEITKSLLGQSEIANMDLFFGPLYPGPYRAVMEYALKNQKYIFNPLSSNPAAIGENPFAYLMRPSLITEGRAAASFAIDSLDKSHAIVITGTSSQDSLRVSSFLSAYQEQSDREVLVLKERNFNRDRIDELVDTLNYFGEDNFIYVASGNELIISNTISAIVMAEEKIPVIGSEELLDIRSITYDQLEGLDEYLIAPGFIDPENENIQEFKNRYRREFYEIPSKYTFVGYDLMMYVGYMLDRYGVYFQEFNSQQEGVNSLLYSGYDYFGANDNQVVPIVKYQDARLRLVDIRP